MTGALIHSLPLVVLRFEVGSSGRECFKSEHVKRPSPAQAENLGGVTSTVLLSIEGLTILLRFKGKSHRPIPLDGK